jgi:hypothetical protein
MNDVYGDITSIIDQISSLAVFPPLVWVWTWDVVLSTLRDFEEDEEYQVNKTSKEVFELFYEQADTNGFSLEYGTEDLYEAIRDWLTDTDIVTEVDGDEEDMLESTGEDV